jgi:hypothetical protein
MTSPLAIFEIRQEMTFLLRPGSQEGEAFDQSQKYWGRVGLVKNITSVGWRPWC